MGVPLSMPREDGHSCGCAHGRMVISLSVPREDGHSLKRVQWRMVIYLGVPIKGWSFFWRAKGGWSFL
jgi:hypothetical protein